MKQAGRVETIISIQILRGIAAMAVAVFHIAGELDRFGFTSGFANVFSIGAAGVDLFFIISGFVMVYASEPLFGSAGGASSFLYHRLVRIVPLYWLVTAFYLALALLMPRLGGTTYPIAIVATSFLFIPFTRTDGVMQPIISQGWTLNYEMFFYAIFAVTVLVPRRSAVVLATTTIVLAVVTGRLLALPEPASVWTDPIILEFVLGMLLGLAYREGVKLTPSLSLTLVFCGIILFALSGHLGTTQRVFTWGVPAAFIVAGATFGGFSFRNSLWHRLAILGSGSYALYLLHTFPSRALLPILPWLSLHVVHWLWLYMVTATTAAVLLALVVHYVFERPVTKMLRRYVTGANSRNFQKTREALPSEWASS